MLTYPFGKPITKVIQAEKLPRKVFVLGVYASAVHAKWIASDGKLLIRAMAVASEPEIFWKGDGAAQIINSIYLPARAGTLTPADSRFNGPSGNVLDRSFLEAIGVTRKEAWLCDLLPESRCNPEQKAALKREYDSRILKLDLPPYNFPGVPKELSNAVRVQEIENELYESNAEILITLGDQPLKWFSKQFGSFSSLLQYGQTEKDYGKLHTISIAGRKLNLLPLVHPRQAGRLGNHSKEWAELHDRWVAMHAGSIL